MQLNPSEISELIKARIQNLSSGVETRTSAPLRILRVESMESVSHAGLYPVGEGAGYAGGIVSAAIDGIKAAEAIINRFAPPKKTV